MTWRGRRYGYHTIPYRTSYRSTNLIRARCVLRSPARSEAAERCNLAVRLRSHRSALCRADLGSLWPRTGPAAWSKRDQWCSAAAVITAWKSSWQGSGRSSRRAPARRVRRLRRELAVRRRRQLPDGDDGVRSVWRGIHAVVAGHALPGPPHQPHGDARVVLPLCRRRASLWCCVSRGERRRAGHAPRTGHAAERGRRRLRGARAALRETEARPTRRGRGVAAKIRELESIRCDFHAAVAARRRPSRAAKQVGRGRGLRRREQGRLQEGQGGGHDAHGRRCRARSGRPVPRR